MFEVDDRFSAGRAVRDRRRGLALRLYERGAGGEGEQFRFVRGGREYVLFVTSSRGGPGNRTLVFHIDQGNLTNQFAGMLAVFARQWLMAELVESFKAYGRLMFGGQVEGVEVMFRTAAESSATSAELIAALMGLRKRYPALLDELYQTLESGRPLNNTQFVELLRAMRELNLRRGGSYRAASDALPELIEALRGPFARRAPDFVGSAMNRAMWALAVLAAMSLWALPNGLGILFELARGQLTRRNMLDEMVELFAGAMSLAIVGAAIYAVVVMIRLARRQQMLSYIRTGNKPIRAQ
jgi:hypothetical protein